MIDPTDIHAQEAAEAQAQADARQAAELFAADLTWIMSDARGRRWVWSLLQASGVYRISYRGGDSHATAFNEGARNLGLLTLAALHAHCPALYSSMAAENQPHRGA